jgi:soluble lytic murein transglycosylase-like protein
MDEQIGLPGRIMQRLRSGLCLSLLGTTCLLLLVTGSSPAWAPEDPWRVVAEIPIVNGPKAATARLLADFLDANGLRLPPGQMYEIASSVAEQSHRYGIEPRLLLSVILSESTFRTDAVSEKGAIGLMQLLPSTAAGLAAELDLKWGGDHRLLDPQTNIALGTYYLKRLLNAFGGDVNLALTAYNKGPGYVQNMLATGVMEATAANYPSSYAEQVVGRLDRRAVQARQAATPSSRVL